MGKLDIMKERYDQITIPEELNFRIQQEIQKSRKQRSRQELQIQEGNAQRGSRGRSRVHSFHDGFEYESGICERSGRTSGDRRSGSDTDIPVL